MKIRKGFVSNSSSSSFLIMGTNDGALMKKIFEMHRTEIDYCEGQCTLDNGLSVFSAEHGEEPPEFAGIYIGDSMMEKTGKELQGEAVDFIFSHYGLKFSNNELYVMYGEISS